MKSVLVVEDERALGDVIAEVLRSRGYEVTVARDGTEAVRISSSLAKPLDVLLCDVIVPGASSNEVVRIGLDLYPKMKVLLMTGWPDEGAIRIGFCDRVCTLHKPFRLSQLLACMKCSEEGNACVETGHITCGVVADRSMGPGLEG